MGGAGGCRRVTKIRRRYPLNTGVKGSLLFAGIHPALRTGRHTIRERSQEKPSGCRDPTEGRDIFFERPSGG